MLIGLPDRSDSILPFVMEIFEAKESTSSHFVTCLISIFHFVEYNKALGLLKIFRENHIWIFELEVQLNLFSLFQQLLQSILILFQLSFSSFFALSCHFVFDFFDLNLPIDFCLISKISNDASHVSGKHNFLNFSKTFLF